MSEAIKTVQLICKKCNKSYTIVPSLYPTYRKYCDQCRKLVNKESWGKRQIVVKEDITVIPKTRKPKNNYKDKYPDCFNVGLVTGTQGDLRDRFQAIYIENQGFMIETRDALYQDEKYKAEVKGLGENERCVWLLGFLNKAIDMALNERLFHV